MYCKCGCGQKTKVSKWNIKEKGWIAGQPRDFVHGHHKGNYQGKDKWLEENRNKHLCKCGCGEYIEIKKHHYSCGIPKFIWGHHANTDEIKKKISEYNKSNLGPKSNRWKKDRSKIRGRIRAKVEFTKRMKRDIYVRDNGVCQHCGMICLLDVDNNHPWKVNIDHIIPVENGGDNELSNGQVLCLSCHKLKHASQENRMNSGKPRTGNPEPSVQSTKVQRLLECSDTLNYQLERPTRKG